MCRASRSSADDEGPSYGVAVFILLSSYAPVTKRPEMIMIKFTAISRPKSSKSSLAIALASKKMDHSNATYLTGKPLLFPYCLTIVIRVSKIQL
jgi:hypothetical protein